MADLGVVIPAHNEAATIARVLDVLSSLRENAEVVVVCNGCTDNTADVVRTSAPWASLIELEQGSKPAALRAGDAAIDSMPRLYLDADIVITAEGVRRLVEVLNTEGYAAVAPTPRYDITGAGAILRSYYRVWIALQDGVNAVYGTGTILVSIEGRARFGAWPDVLADDYFLDQQIEDDHKARVGDVEVIVRMPTRLSGCISRRARVHQGNRELRDAGLLTRGSPGNLARRTIGDLVRREPRMLVHLPSFLGVTSTARFVSLWRRWRGTAGTFHRDTSSRGG